MTTSELGQRARPLAARAPSTPHAAPRGGAARFAAFFTAAALTAFGILAVWQGVNGRATVHDALAREAVVGTPTMTPAASATQAKQAGLHGVALPSCTVAGKPVNDGATARCFAQYMRIDALSATHGATYAQLPRFATLDGRGTNDPNAARKSRTGQPVENPVRTIWITEAALSTALNTSYMAEQISLFGIAVGAAFLLVALAFTAAATRLPRANTIQP